MIQVLCQVDGHFSVYVDPVGTSPVACIARWQDGLAMIVLGTWEVTAGDSPPDELVEWLKSNERYLWDVWNFYLYDPRL